jgi:hypothetical protein
MNFRNPLHFQIQTEQSNHAPGQLEEVVRQPEVVVRSQTTAYTSYFITIVSGEMKSFQEKLEGRHSCTAGPVT